MISLFLVIIFQIRIKISLLNFSKPILFIVILVIVFSVKIIAQKDSLKIAKPLINIGDSSAVSDSLTKKRVMNVFRTDFSKHYFKSRIANYKLVKKDIDKIDYKYAGNLISYLPFGLFNNFGYTGAPHELNVFSFGYNNLSLSINNSSANNLWNNSSDFNKIQTEDISKIEIVPLTRAILYGVLNNPSAVNLISNDTLKHKPISRIRFYQAPNNEGLIDAMFSAKVMPRISAAFRVTNVSSSSNLTNSDYSSWKANFKSIYKVSDSIYAKINYYHLNSVIGLNGGVNVNSSNFSSLNIYDQFASVYFNDRYSKTTINDIGANFYGKFFKDNFTKIDVGQNYNTDNFKQNITSQVADSLKIKNENKYSLTFARFTSEQKFNNFSIKLSSGYEYVDYSIKLIDYNRSHQNYFIWMLAQYEFLNKSISSTAYAKYSKYDSQNNNGFGGDIIIKLLNPLQFFIGYSNFQKPYSIIERVTLPKTYLNKEQTFSNIFTSFNYSSHNLQIAVSYFNSKSFSSPIPVFNSVDIELNSTRIIFNSTENVSTDGINLNSNLEFWNILTQVNFNYYNVLENSKTKSSDNYNLTAGLYYVDTLYNSNLKLKTGFTFYMNSNPQMMVYDFQELNSTGNYLNNGKITPFPEFAIVNNPYKLDFFLSGRIQDLATFFFVYENILGSNYYIVPYYPISSSGIRLGISWDFLN